MLRTSIAFLVIAIIAAIIGITAVLGFTGVERSTARIAEVFYYIFIVLFIISLIFGRRPTI